MRRRRRPDRPHRPGRRTSSAGPTPRARSSQETSARTRTIPRGARPGGRRPGRRASAGPFWTGDYVADPRFPHGARADAYVETLGIHSVMAAPLIGETGPFGALTSSAGRPNAWTEADAGLLQTIADQAAITIRTTRLIEALDRSREALARRAGAEQALREIAARITVLRDPGEILRDVVDPGRPPGRRGRRDPRPARSGHGQPALGARRRPRRPVHRRGAGAALDLGRGRRDRDRRRRGPGRPRRRRPRRAVPAVARVDRVLRADRLPFDDRRADHRRSRPARRHRGLRDEAGRVRRDRRRPRRCARQPGRDRHHQRPAHRGARARRAGDARPRPPTPSGRCARSPARVSAMRDQDEILQAVIDAAVRLLGRGGRDDRPRRRRRHGRGLDDHGRSTARPRNSDLLSRGRARRPTPASRACRCRPARSSGPATTSRTTASRTPTSATPSSAPAAIQSVIAAPLVHRDVVVGAITVYGDRADAFDAEDAALLRGPRRPGRGRHRQRPAHRGARAVARGDRPARRFGADAARDRGPRVGHPRARPRSSSRSSTRRPGCSNPTAPGSTCTTPRSTPCAGRTRPATRCRSSRIGRRPAASSPARPSPAPPSPSSARSAPTTTSPTTGSSTTTARTRSSRDAGIRSVIAVPLAGDAAPASGQARRSGRCRSCRARSAAYDEPDGEILTALATQASIAIRNARLIDELGTSRAVIERRAEAEQALREIAARITAIREPGDLLQHVVDEAFRLLRADGAVIDQFDPDADGSSRPTTRG